MNTQRWIATIGCAFIAPTAGYLGGIDLLHRAPVLALIFGASIFIGVGVYSCPVWYINSIDED